MDLYRLPETAVEALRRRRVDPRAERIATFMFTCLLEGAQTVAEDLGPDRYDDAISQGVARWRRATNRMLREKRRWHVVLEGLELVEESSALLVRDGDVVVSFYSAPNGVEHPDLSGSGRRQRIIDEQQLQLNGMPGEPVKRLVLLYRADDDGIMEAALALMASARDPEWVVRLYVRGSGGDDGERLVRPTGGAPTSPSYDEQPVPELPPLRRRIRPDEKETTG